MESKNLAIHFGPGARGDFLASVLCDAWTERGSGALHSPKNYKKIHFLPITTMLENTTLIRIDANNDINNIMQISFNHMNKNIIELKTSYIDQFYLYTVDLLKKDAADRMQRIDYDYWLDFASLSDLTFIEEFYLTINSAPIDARFLQIIATNIQSQLSWKNEPALVKLSKLIDFENRFQLFNWYKNFNTDNFSYDDLRLKNYSPTRFVNE